MSLKLLYRNPRQHGDAMKLVPDHSHSAAEKRILKGLGFTVIEITAGPSFSRHARTSVRQERGWLE